MGNSFRGTAAKAAPASAFKHAVPAKASSTPLRTAAARTSMAAFSGVFIHSHVRQQ